MSNTKIVLRKKELSTGGYPVCIRLFIAGHNATYIRLDGLSCTEEQWNSDLSRFNKNKPDYKALNSILNDKEEEIETITNRLLATSKYTYRRFKEIYTAPSKIDDNVVNAFNRRIDELKQLDKQGTAKMYSDGLVAFLEFTKTNQITFEEIDYKFIQGFKKSRLKKGNKVNTIATYLRGLRAIVYNHYKMNNLNRPFIEFDIKTEPTRHRALTREQLKTLLNYKPLTKFEKRAIDIFMFSFWCRGANLMDLSQLKQSSIINNRIEYKRSKTGGLFSIPIIPELQKLIDEFKSDNSPYLLPVLKNGDNIKETVVNFNRSFNKTIARIADKLDLPPITFYYARYTYVNILKNDGVGIDILSQLLGHSSIKVTETYLNSFANEHIDKASQIIL